MSEQGKWPKSVNVLGVTYEINVVEREKDLYMKENNCDGWCDKTSHKIVAAAEDKDNELECYESYLRKIIRHEIIHAFLFESGLGENWSHSGYGHDETYVDWFAIQFPKIQAAFREAGVDF